MVLQSIRERLTGVLAFTILGILVVPFALVGVNSYFTASGGNNVARINDAEISFNDFNQSFSNYRRRMQSIMGAEYDPVQMDQLTVRREHLDNLINDELITQAAQSMVLMSMMRHWQRKFAKSQRSRWMVSSMPKSTSAGCYRRGCHPSNSRMKCVLSM